LISLSPLPSAHPRALPRAPVRASTVVSHGFPLAKGRSYRFGSRYRDLVHCRVFTLAFTSPPRPRLSWASIPSVIAPLSKKYAVTSLILASKAASASTSLVVAQFQGEFPPLPFPHGTRTLSVVFRTLDLEGQPPIFTRGSRAPSYSIRMSPVLPTGPQALFGGSLTSGGSKTSGDRDSRPRRFLPDSRGFPPSLTGTVPTGFDPV